MLYTVYYRYLKQIRHNYKGAGMFEDHQANNTNHDELADVPAPPVGLGTNPSASAQPTTAPQVVLPSTNDSTMTHGSSVSPGPQLNTPDPHTDSSQPENHLENIKRQALEELSPLVSKLQQAPEEKYKTLMMVIQASDNQSLIHEAYQAAQQIEDEKVKAEALLNIVNEINYFAQKEQ